MLKITTNESIAGSIYATAFGDAWGNLTEFDNHSHIIQTKPNFPVHPMITDDTQMSLYAMQAIQNMLPLIDELEQNPNNEALQNKIRLVFARKFAIWLNDPDNHRAPGQTCLDAMNEFQANDRRGRALTGLEGTRPNSKGCGANMRVMWFGLLPYSTETIVNLSILQSETTHSHPLALSSSVMTALAVKAVAEGTVIPSHEGSLTEWTLKKTFELIANGFGAWNPVFVQGLRDLIPVLEEGLSMIPHFAKTSMYVDMCEFFGEGWVAEQALMNALAATDIYAESPVYGLQRLVYTSGDSDSIAAIGGAMLGAYSGAQAFPDDWFGKLEPRYIKELNDITIFTKELNG